MLANDLPGRWTGGPERLGHDVVACDELVSADEAGDYVLAPVNIGQGRRRPGEKAKTSPGSSKTLVFGETGLLAGWCAELEDSKVRYRGDLADVSGTGPDGRCRWCPLRGTGPAEHGARPATWRAGTATKVPSCPPAVTGTPEEAPAWACGLYLNDPSAWTEPLPPADTWFTGRISE